MQVKLRGEERRKKRRREEQSRKRNVEAKVRKERSVNVEAKPCALFHDNSQS